MYIIVPCEISGSHGGEFEDSLLGLLRRVVWWNLKDISEVFTASMIRAMRHVG
jgi:hypothetical protein